MSKINKLIQALIILIKKPYLINKVLNDDSSHKEALLKISRKLNNGFPIIDLLDLLPNFNESISPFSFLNGGSLPTDIALLKGLANQMKDCTYFEIGTWRGESVANVSQVAKTCFTLNLSNKELESMGYNQEYLNQQGFFSEKIDHITHLKGNSYEFDFSPYYKKCDIVFIDGEHKYETVVNDTQIAFKLLKDEYSIIIWHDYASHPGEIRWDILRGIWEGSPNDKKNSLYAVSNTLCAIYTSKKYSTTEDKLTPSKLFNINLKAQKLTS